MKTKKKENRSESARFEILKEVFSFNEIDKIKGISIFDDAAIIEIDKDNVLIIASDFVRGTGFTLFQTGLLSYEDVGYYLIAANLSDVAAMGCRPIGLTNVFRYESDLSNDDFRKVLQGMKKACDDYGAIIVGGDIGSYQSNVVTATAFGFMKKNKALLRSGAKSGDILCFSGDLGLPFTALIYFEKAKKEGFLLSQEEEEKLLNSWRKPIPRIESGVLLAENFLASSCQDVSDGLKASIDQISKASGVFFMIDESSLPIHNITKKVANFIGVSPVSMALSASVDFSLLFTVPQEKIKKCEKLFTLNQQILIPIGKAISGEKNLMISESGSETAIPGLKWNHNEGTVIEQFFKTS